ncbi:MAG: hemolysin family protein [Actinomycetota bacterium]|jgi:putative hemolysin|nr:hemolysin family protein [Actinomycetota bacterium]
MELLLAVTIMIISTLLSGLMAVTEASAALISRSRVRRLLEAERRGARSLDAILEYPSRVIGASALIAIGAAAVSSACGAWALVSAIDDLPMWGAIAIASVFSTMFTYSLGQALPRSVAVQNPEEVALTFAAAAHRVSVFVYPSARMLGALWRWGLRLTGGERADISPWATEDEFRAHGSVDEEYVAREESEDALIDAVADFTEKVVREVMVPRPDMAVLADTATPIEAVEIIEREGYSRVPVYRETVDDVLGILYAKDLLIAARDSSGIEKVDLLSIVRPAYFVPETKPVEELLFEMRSRTHIAIVADEYGGTAGLVTIEDLLEEIVGEIFDEYDSEVPLVVDIGGGAFRVDCRLPVDDLNERFGTAIEMDAVTVGGVFTELAGRIPETGETIEIDGLRLTVDALEGTRIRQLVVEPAPSAHNKEVENA